MNQSGYMYHCAAGESWDSIALAVYGDEKYAAELISANPEHSGRLIFMGGEKLLIPAINLSAVSEYAPSNAPWRD